MFGSVSLFKVSSKLRSAESSWRWYISYYFTCGLDGLNKDNPFVGWIKNILCLRVLYKNWTAPPLFFPFSFFYMELTIMTMKYFQWGREISHRMNGNQNVREKSLGRGILALTLNLKKGSLWPAKSQACCSYGIHHHDAPYTTSLKHSWGS